MADITRRQFLRRMVAGLGTLIVGWFLGACGRQETPVPTVSPVPTRTLMPATPTPTATSVPTTVPVAGYPDLVVARGGEPDQLVRRALAAIGGMERFVDHGDDVIIKPNICVAYHSYEYAATTNPWVIAALVKLCLEAGARRVRVMDSPFGGGPEEAYVRSGIQEQVLAAGGEMEIMSNFKFVSTKIPRGWILTSGISTMMC